MMHTKQFREKIKAQSNAPGRIPHSIRGAIEALKKMELCIFGNTDTSILYADLDGWLTIGVHALAQPDCHLATKRTIFYRILHQVADDLLQACAVTHHAVSAGARFNDATNIIICRSLAIVCHNLLATSLTSTSSSLSPSCPRLICVTSR